MTPEQERYAVKVLQPHGYTNLRYHETHKWCGRQGDDACTGICEDGSCMTRNACGGGMEAVAFLDRLCAPAEMTAMGVFGAFVLR